MKFLTKLLLAFLCIITVSVSAANASGFGVIDFEKVYANYAKAQDAAADLKVKEAELQKFVADAQKEIKNATTPLDKKNTEDKLNNEYKLKAQALIDDKNKQIKDLDDQVFAAMNSVAADKKLDIVLVKNVVLLGGIDITDDVLQILNKGAKK